MNHLNTYLQCLAVGRGLTSPVSLLVASCSASKAALSASWPALSTADCSWLLFTWARLSRSAAWFMAPAGAAKAAKASAEASSAV